MKKYLLPKDGNFYKANLHSHTNVSDGAFCPQDVKKAYLEHGYSIVAFTDHDVLMPHYDLNDENFLALHGYEMELNDPNPHWPHNVTCHMCLIALEPDNLTQVCWNKDINCIGKGNNYKHLVKFHGEDNFYYEHKHECINEIMKQGAKHGFFVTYNHPAWSLENYEDYSGYEYMTGFEIMNYGCCFSGYNDYNPQVYDDLLRLGRRIPCIAGDDNHNWLDPNLPVSDSFGAWTMIKAEKLEYRTITKALKDGNTYVSQGPEIKELWYEDGVLHIETSPAKSIAFTTAVRHTKNVMDFHKNPVDNASWEVPKDAIYVRVTVTDFEGNHACTNAYFMDELDSEEN